MVLGGQSLLAIRLGSETNGPDAATYLRNSEVFLSISTLLDPAAFDYNYWVAGYSGFLSLFTSLGDWQLVAARMAQVVMALSMAFMAYRLTRYLSEKVATWTFVAVALSPTLLWFSLVIGYEVLLGWLIMLSLSLVLLARDSRYERSMVAICGLAFSCALVVQFKVILLLPLLAYLVWARLRGNLLVFFATCALPVGLWMLRNHIALGKPSPWTSNGPINVWIGNNPAATGGYIDAPPIPAGWPNDFVSAALHFASTQPRDFAELQALKALRFFYPNVPIDFHLSLPTLIDVLLVIAFWLWAVTVAVLFVLFLSLTVWRVSDPVRSLSPLAVATLLIFVSNLPFIVEPRFRVPVDALMISVCVPTLVALMSRWQGGCQGSPGLRNPAASLST